jgi:hypothetical protein
VKMQKAVHAYSRNIGTTNGIHPEDDPMEEDEGREPVYEDRKPKPGDTICISDDTFYNERSHSSVVRRCTIPPTAAETRERKRVQMRVTRHEGPPHQSHHALHSKHHSHNSKLNRHQYHSRHNDVCTGFFMLVVE